MCKFLYPKIHTIRTTAYTSDCVTTNFFLADINMYGCDKFAYSGNGMVCTNPAALGVISVFFFVIFTVIGSLVLLSLFIGVITTAMQEAQDNLDAKDEKERLLKEIIKKSGLKMKQIDEFQAAFDLLDVEADGNLTYEEIRRGLQCAAIKLPEQKLVPMLRKVDLDMSGEIDFVEFVEFMANAKAVAMGHPPPLSVMANEVGQQMKAIDAFLKHQADQIAIKPTTLADLDLFASNLKKSPAVHDKWLYARNHLLQYSGELIKYLQENFPHYARTKGLASMLANEVEMAMSHSMPQQPHTLEMARTPASPASSATVTTTIEEATIDRKIMV